MMAAPKDKKGKGRAEVDAPVASGSGQGPERNTSTHKRKSSAEGEKGPSARRPKIAATTTSEEASEIGAQSSSLIPEGSENPEGQEVPEVTELMRNCQYCNKRCKNRNEHEETHKGTVAWCSVCHTQLKTTKSFKEHARNTKCGGKCEIRKIKDPDPKKFDGYGNELGTAAAQERLLKKSKCTKNEKGRFQCKQCPSSFKNESICNEHAKIEHEGYMVRCTQCALEPFSSRYECSKHLKETQCGGHCSIVPPPGLKQSISQESALRKKFACPYDNCDYTSRDSATLQNHMRLRHKQYEVKCTACQETFKGMGVCKRHKCRNTGGTCEWFHKPGAEALPLEQTAADKGAEKNIPQVALDNDDDEWDNFDDDESVFMAGATSEHTPPLSSITVGGAATSSAASAPHIFAGPAVDNWSAANVSQFSASSSAQNAEMVDRDLQPKCQYCGHISVNQAEHNRHKLAKHPELLLGGNSPVIAAASLPNAEMVDRDLLYTCDYCSHGSVSADEHNRHLISEHLAILLGGDF